MVEETVPVNRFLIGANETLCTPQDHGLGVFFRIGVPDFDRGVS
jgi:hypothetical protein